MAFFYKSKFWAAIACAALLGACARYDKRDATALPVPVAEAPAPAASPPPDDLGDRDIRPVESGSSGSAGSAPADVGVSAAAGASGSAAPQSGAMPAITAASTGLPASEPVVIAQESPAAAPADAKNIFYNASLAPQLARDAGAPAQPVLRVAANAVLSFDIGQRRVDSLTPHARAAPAISGARQDLPLTIVFGCEFCAPDTRFRQHIVYRPRLARSQQVRFAFTPAERKDQKSYRDELYLIIIDDRTGYPIDRVSIPVTVRSAPGAAAAAVTRALHLPDSARMAPPGKRTRPDLIIYAVEAPGPSISLSIVPISAPMRRLLGPLVTHRGQPKSFISGKLDAGAIDEVATWSFHSLKALSLQEKELQKLRASGATATLSDEARATLVFDPDEAAGTARVIAASGQQLYQKLFFGGPDKSLAKIIALIE